MVATEASSYKGYRYPVEIISHCVWLYYRFALSLRDISEMKLERGVVVSHETGLPRVFRTVDFAFIYAASCEFRYSVRTSCGVR